ncbi:hypothetical protein J6590_058242 [Homalodisca vitripennis]|nr:hypothetical protein J6590_058242 [Homalodisca vitripennis]
MPAPHPQDPLGTPRTPRTDPSRPTVHGTNVSVNECPSSERSLKQETKTMKDVRKERLWALPLLLRLSLAIHSRSFPIVDHPVGWILTSHLSECFQSRKLALDPQEPI